MIVMLTMLLYIGGIIGTVRNAPKDFKDENPVQVLISAFLWPGVIVSILVQLFLHEYGTWSNKNGGVSFKK